MKCENCIANLDGECIADECQGQVSMTNKSKVTKENLKKLYEMNVAMFQEDFKDEHSKDTQWEKWVYDRFTHTR